MSVLLTMNHVTIGYRGNPVLSDLTLEVCPGDAMAVLGVNGSGKTTFLKTLAGILPPLIGEVRFGTSPGKKRALVGYIPQRATLSVLLPLTAREVVELGTYGNLKPWQGMSQKNHEQVDWAIQEVGVAELQRERYADLSGGQQQRVLIARALAAAPDMLVLDEPLASLDQESVQVMVSLLAKLKVDTDIALLWADHFVLALGGVVQEVLLIENGKLTRRNVDMILEQEHATATACQKVDR